MGEVKRYDSYGYDGMSGLMKEHADGDWVRSEDYDALRAENAVLKTAYEETEKTLMSLYNLILPKLRAERDELLALLLEFCERVDRGEVRSVKTYEKFKAAIAKHRGDK